MVKIDTLRILSKCFKILANQFYECIYTCMNTKECLTNAVANFTNALRMKQQHDACVLYAYTVLPVFLFFLYLPAPTQLAYPIQILLIVRIPPLFYTNARQSLQTSYDHYKCIVINKNGLLLLLKNMLQICFPYGS